MGLMTSTQADACKIMNMSKRVHGSDTSWKVGVNDTDGNYYVVILECLSDNPTKNTIKTAVLSELVKLDKQSAKVIPVVTEIEDKGLGETLG